MENGNRIRYIDTLKGIGALIIVIYHLTVLFGIPFDEVKVINYIFTLLSSIGYIPVEMFFFFSGYLMIHSYSKKIEQIIIIDFIKNKIKKLYPYVMINVFLCTAYDYLINKGISVYQIFYNLIFMQCGFFKGTGDFRMDISGEEYGF